MQTAPQRGARVQSQKRAPSVDLVHLVNLMCKVLEPDGTPAASPAQWPIFSYDPVQRQLHLQTHGLLRRLYQHPQFREDFRHGEATGFLRDVLPTNLSMDAKMGGRLSEERQADLTQAMLKLKEALNTSLAQALPSPDAQPDALTSTDGATYMTQLARALQTVAPPAQGVAHLVPLHFAEPGLPTAAREDEVARVVAAIEEVESRGWLDSFVDPARRVLAKRGLDEEEIEGVLANVAREAERLDSQMVRFFNFLDDEALARIRLEVTFAIMDALKNAASRRSDPGAVLLVGYVHRVQQLVSAYRDTEVALTLDLSQDYGQGGRVNVSDELRKANFYGCLPVWPDWKSQLFELRPVGSGALTREVSYRFRINGENPREQMPAFLVMLNEIEEVLVQASPEQQSPYLIGRNLARLLVLKSVLPAQQAPQGPDDFIAKVQSLAAWLSKQGREGVKKLIDDVRRQAGQMNKVATALIETLRSKGRVLLGAAEKQVSEQYLCVQRGIVDWDRLSTATGQSKDFLVRAEEGQTEKPQWFKHLVIARNPLDVPDLLFSVKVRVRLRERSLARAGVSQGQTLFRQVAGPVLPVIWWPGLAQQEASGRWDWMPDAEVARWLAAPGVCVDYADWSLARPVSGKQKKEDQQQWHAALVAATALLVHLSLWLIRERLRGSEGLPRLMMLRFQAEGKTAHGDKDRLSGTEVMYAIAQAVELALANEAQVFMQGLALQDVNRFKVSGTYAALQGAFPVVLRTPTTPEVPRLGLISYATRPCDEHPAFPEADGYLYTAKTYLAEAVTEPFPGYRLWEDRTQTYLQSRRSFEEPSLILEEVGRLRELGCQHVLLLGHHYGNWHIGRTAARHTPHTKPEFLNLVAAKFPDVTLYTLRHDVFPATRLRQRAAEESAFEVLQVREHEEFWQPADKEVRRDLVPVYTFATLRVVGDDGKRPQSGFCTYFLETDSRTQHLEWAERARSELVDIQRTSTVRPALLAMLRGLHFLHAEKPGKQGQAQPILDPHGWVNPATIGGAGEIMVISSRRRGGVVLSLPALLAQASTVLRGA